MAWFEKIFLRINVKNRKKWHFEHTALLFLSWLLKQGYFPAFGWWVHLAQRVIPYVYKKVSSIILVKIFN
jgi:hypothetical protein